ncbi:Putative amidoligase enzyme [Lasallia pustulata]|uniref:Putative amidoligase enzyme n=1 Tax=Lasallia pustulata TaxID=136370 RepID=A0A1W5CUC0_9LECA|nr:Putative amidoligase enzyme [Lasallia pustulata]
MDGPFDLTFGVELEFIVVYIREDYLGLCDKAFGPHHHSEEEFEIMLLQHIVDVLRASSFAVNDPHHDYILKWTVTTNKSVEVEVEKDKLSPDLQVINRYAVELKSPAYRHTREALLEVQRAVDVIKKEFSVFVNETCGFHVHVGNRDRGFTLETMKNLSLLVTIFERQFNQLHPRHRISNSWCQTPAFQFPGRNLWEIFKAIEAMPDIRNLIGLMCGGSEFPGGSKYRAYNLCNLTDENIKTIEFRQHQGTMDECAILYWTSLTCRLVIASHQAGPVGFIELVKEHGNKPNFTVLDLLHHLKLDDLLRYYLYPYYSTRSTSHRKRKGLWVNPPTGEWLAVGAGDGPSRDTTNSNGSNGDDRGSDGNEGSRNWNRYLNRLYRMVDAGGDVNGYDIQFISQTFWKDI